MKHQAQHIDVITASAYGADNICTESRLVLNRGPGGDSRLEILPASRAVEWQSEFKA